MYGTFWTIYWQYWADRRKDDEKEGNLHFYERI